MAFKENDWVEYMDHGRVLFTGRVLSNPSGSSMVDVEDFTSTDATTLPAYKLREAEPRRVAALLRLTMVPIQNTLPGLSVGLEISNTYGPPGTIENMWRGNHHTKDWHLLIDSRGRWFWFNDEGEVVPT